MFFYCGPYLVITLYPEKWLEFWHGTLCIRLHYPRAWSAAFKCIIAPWLTPLFNTWIHSSKYIFGVIVCANADGVPLKSALTSIENPNTTESRRLTHNMAFLLIRKILIFHAHYFRTLNKIAFWKPRMVWYYCKQQQVGSSSMFNLADSRNPLESWCK
jgi:hypothetical protein